MNTARFPIFVVSLVSATDFVRFWDRLYTFDDADYLSNIGPPLTADRIKALFAWKNATSLSAPKRQSIQPYLSGKERIGKEASADELAAFLTRPGGAIWRIFWLHLQHPQHFPIYDQQVHRAMSFLLGSELGIPRSGPELEIPRSGPAKVSAYLESFRPFFDRFNGCDPRQVDRALWSFGRFLKPECNREALSEGISKPPQPY